MKLFLFVYVFIVFLAIFFLVTMCDDKNENSKFEMTENSLDGIARKMDSLEKMLDYIKQWESMNLVLTVVFFSVFVFLVIVGIIYYVKTGIDKSIKTELLLEKIYGKDKVLEMREFLNKEKAN